MQGIFILLLLFILPVVQRKRQEIASKRPRGPPLDFVYMMLNGGLGNQLFQIACAFTFCRDNGKTLYLSRYERDNERKLYYDSWYYRCSKYRSPFLAMTSDMIMRAQEFKGSAMMYDQIPPDTTYLTGMFQNFRYFAHREKEIRQLFQLPAELEAQFAAHYATLLSTFPAESTVVVHVRRGDYLTSYGGVLYHLDEQYYAKAVRRALEEFEGEAPRFLVFSEDVAWCREQECFRGATIVDDKNDVRSLWIMSQFKHYIMSNSTFCWWSVFLNNSYGRVIAPLPWHHASTNQQCDDVYLENWIKLPVKNDEK